MEPDPPADDDVQALFSRIEQSNLPYRVFDRPPVPVPAPEPDAPDPAPPAAAPTEAAALLNAYAPKPEAPAPHGPIPLKALFAYLAGRGPRDSG